MNSVTITGAGEGGEETIARLAGFVGGLADRGRGAFLEERERWLLFAPVLFGVGVAGYFALKSEPPLWISIFAPIAGGLAWQFRWRQGVGLLFLALFLLAAGFSVAQWRTEAVSHAVLDHRLGPLQVEGRVAEVELFPNGSRVTLDRIRTNRLPPDRQPPRVRIRLRGEQPAILPGNWIAAYAVLSPPPPPVFPGAFDLQRQFYFQQLGAVGFALGAVRVISTGDDSLTPVHRIERLRLEITARVMERIGGDAGQVSAALLTGQRTVIREPVLEAFRKSGIAHLLAISGLHIGLLAGFVFVGLRAVLSLFPRLALNRPIKKWAAFVAVIAAFGYALIAGATVPTQRAFLMIALVLLAVLMDRQGISMRLVAWAALVILAITPEALLGASFQMSFAAVVALIAAYEWLREHHFLRPDADLWWRRPAVYFAGVVITTLVASAATGPFVIYHFNRIAAFGMIANVVAVPLTAFLIMPMAVIAFVLMPVGLDGPPLVVMGWGVDVVVRVAEWVSAMPGAGVAVPPMPTAGLVAVVAGGVWLFLWRTKWRMAGLAAIAAGLASIALARPPDVIIDGDGRLFAVRQADGALVLSSRRVERFSGEVWLRMAGQAGKEAARRAPGERWPETGFSADGRLSCDGLGCLYRKDGLRVALVRDPLALLDDCRRADIIIAAVPVRRRACPSAMRVVDRFDLWRDGAHAIWIDGNGIRVKSVDGVRGRRPWMVEKRSRRAH